MEITEPHIRPCIQTDLYSDWSVCLDFLSFVQFYIPSCVVFLSLWTVGLFGEAVCSLSFIKRFGKQQGHMVEEVTGLMLSGYWLLFGMKSGPVYFGLNKKRLNHNWLTFRLTNLQTERLTVRMRWCLCSSSVVIPVLLQSPALFYWVICFNYHSWRKRSLNQRGHIGPTSGWRYWFKDWSVNQWNPDSSTGIKSSWESLTHQLCMNLSNDLANEVWRPPRGPVSVPFFLSFVFGVKMFQRLKSQLIYLYWIKQPQKWG